MKYIKFIVSPKFGKGATVVFSYRNADRRPPLRTWEIDGMTVDAIESTARERRNYVRRGLTGYEGLLRRLQ